MRVALPRSGKSKDGANNPLLYIYSIKAGGQKKF
jgi:hypothetical protein